jgi:Flp pilus assembly protein TadB
VSPTRPAAGLAIAVTSLLTFLSGLVAATCLVLGLLAVSPLLLAAAALACVSTIVFFRASRRIAARHDRER